MSVQRRAQYRPGPLVVVVGLGAATVSAAAAAVLLEDTGVAIVVAAAGVILAGLLAWIAYQFLVIRDREQGLNAQRTEIDLIRLQGDLVSVLRQRHEHAVANATPENLERLRSDLGDALDRYEAMLRGLLKVRPELAVIERRAISTYLDEAAGELRRLDETQASWSR